MFYYKFYLENFEGIDAIYEFMHENEYDHDTFYKICKEVILDMFQEKIDNKVKKYIRITEFDEFSDKMKEHGFKNIDIVYTRVSYDPWTSDDPQIIELNKKLEEYNDKNMKCENL